MDAAERRLWAEWKRGGREEAFNALVRPHLGFAHGLARRMGCAHEDAEDCVQRALFDLVRRRPDLSPVVGMRAWLGRAVVLQVRMLRRGDRRREARERAAAMTASTSAENLEVRAEVEAALARLPEAEREVVVLRYLHDMEYAEIARFVGASSLACRLRVHRALKRLRRQLGRGAPVLILLGVRPRLTPMGALAMTTGSKLALGTGIALSVAAVLVGGAAILHRDTEPPPARAESSRSKPSPPAGEEPLSPRTEPPPDVSGAAGALEEAAAAETDAVKQLSELQEGVRSLEAGMKAIEASQRGSKPEPSPDPLTQRYLQDLADTYRRLSAGEERERVLETFVTAYANYVEKSGDTTLEPFLDEVLDRSDVETERKAAGRALVGRDPAGERLLRLVESPHAEVRRPAVLALPWVRDAEREACRERVYAALDDEDRSVRLTAATVLTTAMPGLRAADALMARLEREEDPVAAGTLARSVMKVDADRGRRRVEDLLPRLRTEVRESVAAALAKGD